MSWPAIGIITSDPRPRGESASPACNAGIAEQRLQEDRQQHQAGVQHEAQHRHQEDAGAEGAVLEHAQVDDGMLGLQLADHHGNQSEDAQRRPQANLIAAEPVLALAGVEHHLQHAEAQRQEADAPQVDAAGLVLADVVRIAHESADHQQRTGRRPAG